MSNATRRGKSLGQSGAGRKVNPSSSRKWPHPARRARRRSEPSKGRAGSACCWCVRFAGQYFRYGRNFPCMVIFTRSAFDRATSVWARLEDADERSGESLLCCSPAHAQRRFGGCQAPGWNQHAKSGSRRPASTERKRLPAERSTWTTCSSPPSCGAAPFARASRTVSSRRCASIRLSIGPASRG